tara:strand:- start:796 stop:1449 length:654 start_codon:yes stop_codon:yes gene_type:complete
MIKKIFTFVLFIFTVQPIYVYSKTVDLNKESPIYHLTIQAGVIAHVKCSSHSNLNLQGIQPFLSDVTYHHDNNMLIIDAHQNGGAIKSATFITAHIQLKNSIQSLAVQRGGFVTVDSCVVDNENLSLDLQQGAHVSINGHTKNLSIQSSRGGFLNKEGDYTMTADHAFISCTQGCILKMGRVKNISGNVMFGGQVYLPSSTKRVGLNNGVGGKILIY